MELAVLYLQALALGFRGRYRGTDGGDDAIDSYRRRLFTFIYGREPQLESPGRVLFPNALAHPYEGAGERRRLPPVRLWQLILVGVILLQIIASGLLWERSMSDVSKRLGVIEERQLEQGAEVAQ